MYVFCRQASVLLPEIRGLPDGTGKQARHDPALFYPNFITNSNNNIPLTCMSKSTGGMRGRREKICCCIIHRSGCRLTIQVSYVKSEVIPGIVIADVPDHFAEQSDIVRRFTVFHPFTYDTAQDAPEVLMSGI